MINVPAPLQPALPYLKFIASLLAIVTGTLAVTVTPPGWLTILTAVAGAVAASVGVYAVPNAALLKLVPSSISGDAVPYADTLPPGGNEFSDVPAETSVAPPAV